MASSGTAWAPVSGTSTNASGGSTTFTLSTTPGATQEFYRVTSHRACGCFSDSPIAPGLLLTGGMKSLTEHLWFEVPGRRGFVNITGTIEELVRRSGVQEGLCLVNAMHITASVFINDAEEGLLHDYEVWLEKLAPHAPTSQYQHNRTGEDNADAHMKRQIMGREVVVAITKGKLDFGPWEQIFYGEFDGRRRKRALVKIIGE